MKPRLAAALVTILFGGMLLIVEAETPVSAQVHDFDFEFSPARGPVGVEIFYSGSGCQEDGNVGPQEDGFISLGRPPSDGEPFGEFVAGENFHVDASGRFSGSFVLGSEHNPVPGENLDADAGCALHDQAGQPAGLARSHAPCPFTVTDGASDGLCSTKEEVKVSAGSATVWEGDTGVRKGLLPVTLSKPASQPVTVDYLTQPASAHAPDDYTAVAGTLSFPPGVTTLYVKVPLVSDSTPEGVENFQVRLSNPTNAVLGRGGAGPVGIGVVAILDDDPGSGVRLTVGRFGIVEGDVASRTGKFTVSLSEPASSAVTVDFATSNLFATAPDDFQAKSGSLTIPAGATSIALKVAVHGDALEEGTEKFKVTLSNAVNAVLSDAGGAARILDDDSQN